jgi:hypothetical protein
MILPLRALTLGCWPLPIHAAALDFCFNTFFQICTKLLQRVLA